MKKLITIISMAALVVGVGSALAFKEIKETAHADSHSNALAKVYKSTDELVENSNVIIKAKLPNEYRKEQVSEIVFYVYDAKVDKVYNNETDQKISEGDTVEVYRVIGFDTGGGKEMADIVAPKFQELEQGEYLLFLNGSYDEDLKKHILIPNSPHQLYKSDSSKGLNSKKSVDSQFESISESEALPSINEDDLLDSIK
ncbi:hypothetical protein [Brevibacillus sp. DP1.3A]|uniref:hypothetical protein n=1 Tax=Brevibacillus sp. DP1.3A TaxID=2738867 RepID=UPI00156A8E8C|nr:hypothetical protein [Brevibacillus sp. DP1.3A]UED77457.1 hypothetical protein HP399_013635 [Brevibacillus sp. DP1.3A]